MKLQDVGQKLDARAAGSWRVEGEDLVQTAFWSASDLDARVAEAFRRATLRVSMERVALGIVGAAIDARSKVSITRDLSPYVGSGMWLRRFGATCSIAVPRIVNGVVVAVASVALRDSRDDEAIRLLDDFLSD